MADLRAGLLDQRQRQRVGHSRSLPQTAGVRWARMPEDGAGDPPARALAPGVVDLPAARPTWR